MQRNHQIIILILCSLWSLSPSLWAEEVPQKGLDKTQAVETSRGKSQPAAQEIEVPGEVRANAYASFKVTPRIAAQVIKRQARLGDMVRIGAPLVTLSSIDLAQAQGELVLAEREWARVQGLGQDVVSGRRYIEARVAHELARAKVAAYGMSTPQIEALLRDNDPAPADGTFVLTAPGAGRIVSDDFVEGEIVQPGRVLFDISDETFVWVEARLAPEQATELRIDMPVRIRVGKAWLSGRVIQTLHRLDEQTRTYTVRCEVRNTGDTLHPSQFVYVRLPIGTAPAAEAAP